MVRISCFFIILFFRTTGNILHNFVTFIKFKTCRMHVNMNDTYTSKTFFVLYFRLERVAKKLSLNLNHIIVHNCCPKIPSKQLPALTSGFTLNSMFIVCHYTYYIKAGKLKLLNYGKSVVWEF